MEKYDIIVIGGGPAGITLAKMLGKKKKMALIRPENYSMIYCAMPYVIEGLLPTEKTFKKDNLVTDAGAVLIRSTVTKIDFEEKYVVLEDEVQIAFDKLVIATGATPFIPPFSENGFNGVLGFKTEKDMLKINQLIEVGAKNAVVVGAGAIGIELAQALNKRGLNVSLVDMADSVLSNLIDFEMANKIEEYIIRSGISLYLKTKVNELQGTKYVEQIILDNGEKILFGELDKCSVSEKDESINIVVFTIGMRPEISLVKNSKIETGKDGITVNDRLETNVADVYAVGDCVQFTSGITGKMVSGKLATNAVPMAKVLGFNFLGQDRTYQGFYNGAATKTGEYYIGGTGLSEKNATANDYDVVCGYSEVTSKFPIMADAKNIHLKLIAERKTETLIGAQIISEEPVTDKVDEVAGTISTSDINLRFSDCSEDFRLAACAADEKIEWNRRLFGQRSSWLHAPCIQVWNHTM